MAKADVLQQSFNVGEVSPLYYGRASEPRYKESMATCLNYVPTLQGPLLRRPGTKYLNAVKGVTYAPILIPFQYSLNTSYMLEFGANYIRFYTNDGQVTSPTNYYQIYSTLGHFTRLSPNPISGESVIVTTTTVTGPATLELVTDYQQSDLSGIRWTQDKDTLYIVHPSFPPRILKLMTATGYEWGLETLSFKDGPYMPLNSWNTLADSARCSLIPSALSGFIHVTSSPSFSISGAANNGSGQIRLTVTGHNFQNGDQVFVSGVVGTTEANNVNMFTYVASGGHKSWTAIFIDNNTIDLAESTYTHAYSSGGTIYPAVFLYSQDVTGGPTQASNGRSFALTVGAGRYFGYLYLYFGNANQALFVMDSSLTLPSSLVTAGTTALANWYAGVWIPQTTTGGGARNNGVFPSCVTFHQDRLCFSGCANAPQEIDMSQTSLYTNFGPSSPDSIVDPPTDPVPAPAPDILNVEDSDAIQFTLLSRGASTIKWIESAPQGMLAGGYESEWTITPSSQSDALTPTNISAQETSYFGSANISSVKLGNATLYVQRAQRKLRELNFFFQVGTFRSTDLSELSEHLTLPTIKKIAVQKETQPLVWAVRSDGQLISMVYNRDDLTIKAGWARHQLGGQSDAGGTAPLVLDIGFIPDPTATFDQMWLLVQRYINGSTVIGIEYMTNFFNDGTLQEDAFQFDGGATYYAPLTITGISTASTAAVTSAAHGLSNGQYVKIVGVVGMNLSTTDINGNITLSNLVNEKTFVVAGVTTNTFQLNDFNGNPISSSSYSAYVSGGFAAKLVTSITGLTWLKGETVSVLTDGGIHPNVVVSNSGGITLNYPAAKVQIGYAYNSDGKLLRPEAGAADGTSFGKTRRVNRVALQVHNIGDLQVGVSFSNLIPISLETADVQKADNCAPLYSGMLREGVESPYDFEGQICFRQNSGLPGMIQSITSFLEEFDV